MCSSDLFPSHDNAVQKICVNNKWEVIDTHNENKTRYKGAYEDVMIACHNLNKKFYRDGVIIMLCSALLFLEMVGGILST